MYTKCNCFICLYSSKEFVSSVGFQQLVVGDKKHDYIPEYYVTLWSFELLEHQPSVNKRQLKRCFSKFSWIRQHIAAKKCKK